jgi:hypothetical protein
VRGRSGPFWGAVGTAVALIGIGLGIGGRAGTVLWALRLTVAVAACLWLIYPAADRWVRLRLPLPPSPSEMLEALVTRANPETHERPHELRFPTAIGRAGSWRPHAHRSTSSSLSPAKQQCAVPIFQPMYLSAIEAVIFASTRSRRRASRSRNIGQSGDSVAIEVYCG